MQAQEIKITLMQNMENKLANELSSQLQYITPDIVHYEVFNSMNYMQMQRYFDVSNSMITLFPRYE